MFSQIQQIQNIQPFPQKLCPVFSTSHVAAQFRNPEAVQETSLIFLPLAHTQTHPHSHQVRTSCITDTFRPILSTATPLYPFGPRCFSALLLKSLLASRLVSLCISCRMIIFKQKMVILRTSHKLLEPGLNSSASLI